MSLFHQNILAGASGAAGGAEAATYVDDVFSTFLYEGTGATQTITNGIDLSGEGGLVWFKERTSNDWHYLIDTERGATKALFSNSTSAESTAATSLTSFTSSGFVIGVNGDINGNGQDDVAWTFRKAPGFFDVVTYTGNGTAGRTVSHSLGSAPGMVVIKNLDASVGWQVYHRSLGSTKAINLNESFGSGTSSNFNNTDPTSTNFTVGSGSAVNGNGTNYVAYLFAHDDQSFGTDSDEAIIKCGSYTGNGTSGHLINVGFEPQWLLWKNSTASSDWRLYDVSREFSLTNNLELRPNESNAEINLDSSLFSPDPVGYRVNTASASYNGSSNTYIYVAIRRPHKPPEAGTDVFAVDNQGTGTMPPQYHSDFPVDWAFTVAFAESQTYRDREAFTRLIGRKRLKLNENTAETNFSSAGWDYMDGWHDNNSSVSTTYSWMFKRTPGFFDVVAYTGTGSATTINHNLGAVPSVVLIKGRDTTFQWYWQHYALGANTWLQLNKDEDQAGNGTLFNSTLPTSSVFSVSDLGGVNGSGNDYIAYLFGDLDGISKAGTYTGTGSNVGVDCGFTAGARFVLIKRADSAGDWYAWDSTRGIVSGNDPYFLVNTDDADVTNTDYLDPLNAGFTVTSSAPAALNTSGGTYLFLAIA